MEAERVDLSFMAWLVLFSFCSVIFFFENSAYGKNQNCSFLHIVGLKTECFKCYKNVDIAISLPSVSEKYKYLYSYTSDFIQVTSITYQIHLVRD